MSNIGHALEAIVVVVVGLAGLGVGALGLEQGSAGGTPWALGGLGVYFAIWAYCLIRVSTRAAREVGAPAQGGAAKHA